MKKSDDEVRMAEAIERLGEDVKTWQRRYRWMSARFVGACVLTFLGMFLVKAYYSAENRREIVCTPRKMEPPSPPPPIKFEICRDQVIQQDGNFVSNCWHPDHKMETMAPISGSSRQPVKCLCLRRATPYISF